MPSDLLQVLYADNVGTNIYSIQILQSRKTERQTDSFCDSMIFNPRQNFNLIHFKDVFPGKRPVISCWFVLFTVSGITVSFLETDFPLCCRCLLYLLLAPRKIYKNTSSTIIGTHTQVTLFEMHSPAFQFLQNHIGLP